MAKTKERTTTLFNKGDVTRAVYGGPLMIELDCDRFSRNRWGLRLGTSLNTQIQREPNQILSGADGIQKIMLLNEMPGAVDLSDFTDLEHVVFWDRTAVSPVYLEQLTKLSKLSAMVFSDAGCLNSVVKEFIRTRHIKTLGITTGAGPSSTFWVDTEEPFPEVTSVSLTDRRTKLTASYKHIDRCLPNLEELDLYIADAADLDIQLPKLRRFSVNAHVRVNSTEQPVVATDIAGTVLSFLENCPNLTHLCLQSAMCYALGSMAASDDMEQQCMVDKIAAALGSSGVQHLLITHPIYPQLFDRLAELPGIEIVVNLPPFASLQDIVQPYPPVYGVVGLPEHLQFFESVQKLYLALPSKEAVIVPGVEIVDYDDAEGYAPWGWLTALE